MTGSTQASNGRFLVAGNWKMNGSSESLQSFHAALDALRFDAIELVLCVPAPLIPQAAELVSDASIVVGAQNCFTGQNGAFTGEISADLLVDSGARYVIVGHSERRTLFGETDEVVKNKMQAALAAGLTAILCVGESSSERKEGRQLDVVLQQLEAALPDEATNQNTIIAYEPVWAIGSGKSASIEQVSEMHNVICRWSEENGRPFRTLYGGSVKPDTAAEIAAVDAVDGFLVGGASLDPVAFAKIAAAAAEIRS